MLFLYFAKSRILYNVEKIAKFLQTILYLGSVNFAKKFAISFYVIVNAKTFLDWTFYQWNTGSEPISFRACRLEYQPLADQIIRKTNGLADSRLGF